MEIRVSGHGAASDDLRELRRRLTDVEELRGRIRSVDAEAGPGSLGTFLEALAVDAVRASAITAIAGVVVSWIRHRTTNTVIKLRRPDGIEVEVTAERVRRLDSAAVRTIVAELSNLAEELGRQPDGGQAPGSD
ncbi:effector-associated constant component EACC1 [Streptomyces sp. NPDC054770]